MGGKPFNLDGMMDVERIVFAEKIFVREPFFEASAYQAGGLEEVLGTHYFRNAVWLASPEFYRELEKKGFDAGALSAKERLTALKFFNRMSFRATPFGAFAAFGLAQWQHGSGGGAAVNQQFRLHLLPAIATQMEQGSGAADDGMLVSVNPTLYSVAGGWRFTRHETDASGKLSFFVCLLHHNEGDDRLLGLLGDKPLALGELSAYLQELSGCSAAEAGQHLAGLLEEQVLLPENGTSLLFREGFCQRNSLDFTEELVLPDAFTGGYGGLSRPENGRSLYAGLELQDPGGVDRKWEQELRAALGVLDRLSPVPPKNALDRFREAFVQKFGERGVSLTEALDPDLGIPLDESYETGEQELLKGLEFRREEARTEASGWNPVHRLFMRVWLQNDRRGKYDPVVLEDHDLDGLKSPGLPLPPSFSVMCSFGDGKLVLHHTGGATANALTGRFSAFSPAFGDFCRMNAGKEAEANPGILFAEVLQVSHRKIDNINRREQIYPRVITLNTFPAAGSLLPAELDVLVSGGEIVLVHRPTGKRVVPRLPTAFNYHHNNMPLFRFLCALQYKSLRANLDFDPEKVFPGLDFYPRIEYGTTILSLARWHLRGDEIEGLLRGPRSISRLHLFCRERGLPVRIAAGSGDQQLVFDLSSDGDALFFLESLRGIEHLVVTESPEDPATMKKGAGHSCRQLVFTLFNPDPVYRPVFMPAGETGVVREFPPGSEWVYLKIYASPQSIGHMLADTLVPWIAGKGSRIRQWFFVRFHDDHGSHLRLRFKAGLSDVEGIQSGLLSLVAGIRARGLVQKAYFDTYQRELERYQASLIAGVETVFYRGSEFIANRLASAEAGSQEEELLWPVLHCYRLITVFYGMEWGSVMALCSWAAGAFFTEHGGEKKLKTSMDSRFRELRPELTRLLRQTGCASYSSAELDGALQSLSQDSLDSSPSVRQRLIADMVHMQVNRIYPSEQRRHELFIWHCLVRLVMSQTRSGMEAAVPARDGR